ncbi:hypothetical protein IPN41_01895 [Candidatus Falkowbacteria bacterium]|nr:MAG: hypothetical protein IPN41_01895 [Candidatus Falkowbacteria bacterium]
MFYIKKMGHFTSSRSLLISFAIGIFLVGLYYTTNIVKASPTNYWFNNAVNTSPATLGNYWLNAGLTVPASELPDLSEDIVNIVAGVTYNGNVTLRGSAVNEGTISGNALFYDTASNQGTVDGDGTFYEDGTENLGTIGGTKIRKYTITDFAAGRDYVSDGPWTVVAAATGINIEDTSWDFDTVFQRENGGYFEAGISPNNVLAANQSVSLFYLYDLIPGTNITPSDFTVTINGSSVAVNQVTVHFNKVVLTLGTAVTPGDTVLVSYSTIGSNAVVLDPNGLNVSISSQTAFTLTLTNDAPVYGTALGTKLYISNNHSATVSVINTKTDTIVKSIPVESYPEFNYIVGKKLYVNNLQSDTVSVIDTTTDTSLGVIRVGDGPYFATVVGRKIYVSNTNSNTVSVIDTFTDTVTATITVGGSPWNSGVIGTKLYVPNRLSNYISVIDTTTDTVVASIATTASSVGTRAYPIGSKMYVGSGNNIVTINTLTDTITSTIPVGTTPYFTCAYGGKLYVPNRASGTVSVINSSSDTVVGTLATANDGPSSCVVFGSRIYVMQDRNPNNSITVIDGLTDTVVQHVTTGYKPFYGTIAGNKLYTSNNWSDDFTVIDTTTISTELPNLVSFTTDSADGMYNENDTIEIQANFGQTLLAGSTMTVQLNSGGSVVLNSVAGSQLYGLYTVGAGETSPDLAVSAITSASVTNTLAQTRTNYTIPSYQPDNPNLIAENSFITRDLGDNSNIVVGSYFSVATGDNPYQISSPVTIDGIKYMYIANQGEATVSVLRLSDQTVVATIPVGLEPYGFANITLSGTTFVYVTNTGSDTVSVINPITNTVIATIPVGVRPYYAAAYGNNIYVTNSLTNDVSVINAETKTVIATVPVGSYPRGIKAAAGFIYVANYGDLNYSGGNSISVINPATYTVSETIISPRGSDGPRGLNVLGTKVYVTNFRSNNVSVIDTASNTITDTIAVGRGPRGVAGSGTKLYIENFEDGTISIINTNTNTVLETISSGHSPTGIIFDGTDIYLTRFQDGSVSILNSTTDTLRPAPPIISNMTTSNITTDSVTINWTTDTSASSRIDYGIGSIHNNSVTSPTLTTNHSVVLSNLSGGRLYRFRIAVTDALGTVRYSSEYTFVTAGGGGINICTNNNCIGSSHTVDPSGPDSSAPDNTTTPTEQIGNMVNHFLCKGWSRLLPTNIINQRLLSNTIGRFLLATEDRGKLWYVDPETKYRYEVAKPVALCLFEYASLGITEDNLNKITEDTSEQGSTALGKRLKGNILLNVQEKGQTWYVDQLGFRHKLNIENLISLASRFALGINNFNLSLLPVGGKW